MASARSPLGRRIVIAVAVVAILAGLAGVGPANATDHNVTRTGTNTTVPAKMVENPAPDPETDRLGWEHGVWYNATLNVTQADGINEAELRAVVARTQARVERVRGIEFDRTPPVRIITRAQNRQESQQGDLGFPDTTAYRQFYNAQYEALFLYNESYDATRAQAALYGSAVLGYYDPSTRNVTMVSPSDDVLQIRELTLSQELFHAQQDEQFNVTTNVSVTTPEARNALLGVIEGDANYMEQLYAQRCQEEWEGTCYVAKTGGPSSPPTDQSYYNLFLQPYQTGVDFVRDRYRAQGWDAINALYAEPPRSTEQTIHPEAYGEDRPADLTVTDRSTDAWEPVTVGNATLAEQTTTNTAGEAGLFMALWDPAYETRGQQGPIPFRSHYNINETTGQVQQPVALNYTHPATSGWDGDVLVPYVNRTNATGYVYKLAWDTQTDAREFLAAYEQLLSYRGAAPVDDYRNTYRIPEGEAFADAFYIERNGSRITVVNAPTVGQLRDIRPGAAPPIANKTDSTATPTPDRNSTTTDTGQSGATATTTGDASPGFGVAVAVAALALIVLLVRRQ
jgi:PGF-CTERM protein